MEMIKKIQSSQIGRSHHGWLNSVFHFSFSEYYNPQNMNFGVLRVLNDDLVQPNTGFDPHPHRDMEIISYVVNGQLTHGDNLGNQRSVKRGDIQYMSAGTGVIHSEHNLGKDTLRFLQLWIIPNLKNHQPSYGDYHFEEELRQNQWLEVVSSKTGNAPIKINQDVHIYVTELSDQQELTLQVNQDRQAYLVLIEGEALINDISLSMRDALEIKEEAIHIKSIGKSHYLVVEMAYKK